VDYRHAKVSDIPVVAKVFATAIDDIDRRHGFFEKPTPTSPPSPQYAFWLKKNPEAFWVAEDRGQVVGYTFSFLRGPLWFLADLFIIPEHQGKGIGGTLVEKTLGSWRGRGIRNRALITPAFNRASVSLYMRYEMLPRQPVYFATATRDAVERGPRDAEGKELEVEDVKDFRASSPLLDKVHKLALGFPSGWHNEFFFEVLKSRCLIFRKRGRLEGYSFVRPNGRLGPLVVRSSSSFAPAFDLTLQAAVEGNAKKVMMFFPGTNRGAVRMGMKRGFRIDYPLLFLSSRPMGDFENYLFYSPGLM
jgi:ribosomal protein S18 acetylase RimI-like enzyme